MRPRTVVALGLVAGYLAFLTHATAGARCPARELGPCARVHAMLARRVPLDLAPALPTITRPMSARTAAKPDLFAAGLLDARTRS
jgi:hypothetical protein